MNKLEIRLEYLEALLDSEDDFNKSQKLEKQISKLYNKLIAENWLKNK